jgi:hypothetical protein
MVKGDEMKTKTIFCCCCKKDAEARLTNGAEIYPHRKDLSGLPFWKHDECGNYVGCHHKTNKPTTPLGNIPTPALRKARSQIHALMDPLWKDGHIKRSVLYAKLSKRTGWTYHTSKIKTVDEASQVLTHVSYIIAKTIAK